MRADAPRLRAGLTETSRTDQSGQYIIVLRNPDNDHECILNADDYLVARQLDGQTSLKQAQDRIAEHFGSDFDLDKFTGLVEKLEAAGMFASEFARAADGDEADTAEPDTAEPDQTVKRISRKPAATGGQGFRLPVPAVFLSGVAVTILGLLVAAAFFVEVEQTLYGELVPVPMRSPDVRTTITGAVEDIYVKKGDYVDQDAPLVQLDDTEYRLELGLVEELISEKQALIQVLKSGASPAALAVRNAERQVMFVEKVYANAERMADRGVIGEADLVAIEELLIMQRKQLVESKDSLYTLSPDELAEAAEQVAPDQVSPDNVLASNNESREVEVLESVLTGLEAQKESLLSRISEHVIRAPYAGVVMELASVGELASVRRGDLIARIWDEETSVAELNIPEAKAAKLVIGQQIYLVFESEPDERIAGVVSSISPLQDKQPDGHLHNIAVVELQLQQSLKLEGQPAGNATLIAGRMRLYEIAGRFF